MPYETGTVNGHRELLDRIRDYVSSEEVMGAEKWEIMRDTATDLILKGPGDSGQDQIYVGAQIFEGEGYANLILNGFVGYDAALAFMDQPGGIPPTCIEGGMPGEDLPQLPLTNHSQMKYWIVANGRRIVTIVRIGVQYEAAYLGFLHPYGLDGQYPYPLAVGGSLSGRALKLTSYTSGQTTYLRTEYFTDFKYSQYNTSHNHFCDPGGAPFVDVSGKLQAGNTFNDYGTLKVRRMDGRWVTYLNRYTTVKDRQLVEDEACIDSQYVIWPKICGELSGTLQAMDGTYHLFPFMLIEKAENNCIGQFDGCFWVTGTGLAPEDQLVIGADTYLAIPNVWREDANNFWALRLS